MKEKNTAKHKKSRIPENIINKVLNISGKRVTYGHRRIWAVLRNEGTNINIKTVKRIIKSRIVNYFDGINREPTEFVWRYKMDDMPGGIKM